MSGSMSDIPLGVKVPQPPDMLKTALQAGYLSNIVNQNKLFDARQAVGEALRASIGDDGEPDQNKLMGLLRGDSRVDPVMQEAVTTALSQRKQSTDFTDGQRVGIARIVGGLNSQTDDMQTQENYRAGIADAVKSGFIRPEQAKIALDRLALAGNDVGKIRQWASAFQAGTLSNPDVAKGAFPSVFTHPEYDPATGTTVNRQYLQPGPMTGKPAVPIGGSAQPVTLTPDQLSQRVEGVKDGVQGTFMLGELVDAYGRPRAQGNAITGGAYANGVVGGENTTGDPAARNPRSTATGDGQFLRDTWLDVVRRNRPDLAGKSDAELLAMRSDPTLSRQMIQAYGQENAPKLQSAGLPVTAATLALAHRLGPADAQKVMQAGSLTPLESILSKDVIAANPDLRGKTAGQLTGEFAIKHGMTPVQFGQPSTFMPKNLRSDEAGSAATHGQFQADSAHYTEDRTALYGLHDSLLVAKTGPEADRLNYIRSLLKTYAPEDILEKFRPIAGTPEEVTAFDKAVKYAAQVQRGQPGAERSDAAQSVAGKASPGPLIDKDAALELTRITAGLRTMRQAAYEEFTKQGRPPTEFAGWYARWQRAQDPRAFAADLYSSGARDKMMDKMTDTERRRYLSSYATARDFLDMSRPSAR